MPGLGNDLVVNLAGNNSKLKSKISESKGGLKSFASSAAGFLNPVTAGLTAIAGAAIGAGVAIYGLQTRIAGLAQIADQATQTGLSGAFIQRLGYAADQSGVSVETLMGGIKKLTIAIGKGDDKPFAALGISLSEMKALNPEQQFLRVAAAISKLPTAAERAAAAVKIFGKSGIDMTGLFADGMSGLNALMADAEKLGIGISAEGLAKAAAADDAIQRMKASFGALLDQITVGVAPAFTLVATAIADLIPPVTKFFDRFNEMDDKVEYIGRLFNAGMAVVFEEIRQNWDSMLDQMAASTAKWFVKWNPNVIAVKGIGNLLGGGGGGGAANDNLPALKQNFQNILNERNPGNIAQQPPPKFGPEQPGGFAKGVLQNINAEKAKTGDIAGIASKAKDLFGSVFMGVAKAAQKEIAHGPRGNGTVAWPTDGDFGKGPGKQETRFAGAMQKGSQEAYSTIVQSVFRGKDPNVQATEKQTVAIVKAVKEKKPFQFALKAAFG